MAILSVVKRLVDQTHQTWKTWFQMEGPSIFKWNLLSCVLVCDRDQENALVFSRPFMFLDVSHGRVTLQHPLWNNPPSYTSSIDNARVMCPIETSKCLYCAHTDANDCQWCIYHRIRCRVTEQITNLAPMRGQSRWVAERDAYQWETAIGDSLSRALTGVAEIFVSIL